MIPVSLYGISVKRCEEFFHRLPRLVANLHDDQAYTDTLFAIDDGFSIEKLHLIDSWAEYSPQVWPEDVIQELTMALMTIRYPDVGLVEHLLTLDGIDAVRVSHWLHFLSNVYPIYSKKACDALDELGVPTPFRPDDIASYGLYVQRLEGLKLHAPAAGLPEIGLPRARVLQIGLERFV
jgi:hypothetical protein